MALTLLRARRCEPCAMLWHFLCAGRRDAAFPAPCGCGCRDEDGLTTHEAFLESARRAPEHLAAHLRVLELGADAGFVRREAAGGGSG